MGQGVECIGTPCGDICHIFRQLFNGFCGIAIGRDAELVGILLGEKCRGFTQGFGDHLIVCLHARGPFPLFRVHAKLEVWIIRGRTALRQVNAFMRNRDGPRLDPDQ